MHEIGESVHLTRPVFEAPEFGGKSRPGKPPTPTDAAIFRLAQIMLFKAQQEPAPVWTRLEAGSNTEQANLAENPPGSKRRARGTWHGATFRRLIAEVKT
jgi:hypothetical protein